MQKQLIQHIHNNFAHFWQHLWFSGIWKSGNCLDWLTNFNVLGIFPTQFLSLNLILCSEIQNSSFPLSFGHWNQFLIQNFKILFLLKIFKNFSGNRNLESFWISLFWANFIILIIFSTQFCSLGLTLASDFQNSNFRWKFSEIWKILRILLLLTYSVSFSLNFGHKFLELI